MRCNPKATVSPSMESVIFDFLRANMEIRNAVNLNGKYFAACGACSAIYYVLGVLGYTPEEVDAVLASHEERKCSP